MESDVAFVIPNVLRVLCYLGAMGVFAAEIIWLSRRAYGYKNSSSLKAITHLWMIRVLVGCVFLSLAHMIFLSDEAWHIGLALPEIAILCLVSALDLLSIQERPLNWWRIITRRLPRAVTMVFVVLLTCVALWALAFALGWVSVKTFSVLGAPVWSPFFVLAVLWNAPLVFLFIKIGHSDASAELKFHNLFWPVLLAYCLILLPDFAEHVGNRFIEMQIAHQDKPIPRI